MPFASMEGRTHTLQELKEIGDHFDALDEKLSVWTREFMRSRGVGIDLLQTELATLLPGMKVPHDPKQIRKKVQVTGACEWRVGDSVECAIVFISDVGNLILSKTGLCLGPQRNTSRTFASET